MRPAVAPHHFPRGTTATSHDHRANPHAARGNPVRKLGVVLGVLAVVLMTMMASPTTASAHAFVLETTPANWQVLDTVPTEVAIRFSEPVDLGLSAVRLIGPQGENIAVGDPTRPVDRPTTVAISVPGLPTQGTYTVAWRAVSSDTHPVQGAFTFSVGAPTGTGAPELLAGPTGSGSVAVLYGLTRWVAFGGFALLVGPAFFVALCWPAGQSRRDLRRVVRIGWVTSVAATVLTFMLYGAYATQQPLVSSLNPSLALDTVDTRMGLTLVARLGLLILIAVAAQVWSRRLAPSEPGASTERRELVRRSGFVLGGAVVLAYTWVLATHSATGSGQAFAEVSETLHLTATGVWLGGLVVLGAVLLRSGDKLAMYQAVPRFSRTALVCVGVLLVTGTFQAWREVGTLAALFGTEYGRVLTIKLALVVGLLGLGAVARAWVRRHYSFVVRSIADKRRARRGPDDSEVRRFRKGVLAEAALAVALLGATAYLVNAAPANAEIAASHPAVANGQGGPVNLAVPFDTGGGGDTGRGVIALVVAPAAIGANEVHLSVLSRSGLPREVAELQASFSLPEKSLGPFPVPLTYGGAPGHYLASAATLPMAGQWQLGLTIRTSEIDQTTARIPITISAQQLSSREIRPK
jgi:copper transport protein